MTWNFHTYYTNRTDGLIGKLLLSDEQREILKELRKLVRTRIKDVFEEAKTLAKTSNVNSFSMEDIEAKFLNTKFQHLTPDIKHEIAVLIRNMDDLARTAFLSLTPRFWTQGSFQYDTLNRPYKSPPQEMDIDDGTYLPMAVFENKPVIGHRLLILLVDSSLKSLVAENTGWIFEPKKTCARIKIPILNTHIDVPMYAIPEQQFLQKSVALKALREAKFESYDSYAEEWMNNRSAYEVDSDCVNLALREGEKKWLNSDPKIIDDWFIESCNRIGRHLRKVCRFLKAWRDAQWESGGPSSILLMVATVNILDRIPHDKDDLGKTMRLLVENLPNELLKGVKSPDHTDDKLLFPLPYQHGSHELNILNKLNELGNILRGAEIAESKQGALELINQAFGKRVTNSELIVKTISAPAFIPSPSVGEKAKQISKTMSSG